MPMEFRRVVAISISILTVGVIGIKYWTSLPRITDVGTSLMPGATSRDVTDTNRVSELAEPVPAQFPNEASTSIVSRTILREKGHLDKTTVFENGRPGTGESMNEAPTLMPGANLQEIGAFDARSALEQPRPDLNTPPPREFLAPPVAHQSLNSGPDFDHARPNQPTSMVKVQDTRPIQLRTITSLGDCPRAPHSAYSLRVTKNGQSFFVNRAHYFWRDYPGWEPGTFRVFQELAVNKVVLDIGAWIGPTVLWLAQVAPIVVALEPTQTAFRELCRSIAMNKDVAGRVVALHAAMDKLDRTVRITNRGDSMDRFLQSIDVRAVSIDTLRKEVPVLEDVGFVKVDTEGYERVIIPALRDFFIEKRPAAYVSLHPMYISHAQVQQVVDDLRGIFPFLYEQDMRTLFKDRESYTGGDHGGTDIVCSWQELR